MKRDLLMTVLMTAVKFRLGMDGSWQFRRVGCWWWWDCTWTHDAPSNLWCFPPFCCHHHWYFLCCRLLVMMGLYLNSSCSIKSVMIPPVLLSSPLILSVLPKLIIIVLAMATEEIQNTTKVLWCMIIQGQLWKCNRFDQPRSPCRNIWPIPLELVKSLVSYSEDNWLEWKNDSTKLNGNCLLHLPSKCLMFPWHKTDIFMKLI